MKTKTIALTAGLGLVAATAAVFLVEPAQNFEHKLEATQGMIAIIDQESGELRAPNAEEALRYQLPAQRNTDPLPVERRADGSESMKLDDRYITYSTVQRLEDGSWSRQCSLDHDHAQHAHRAVQ